MQKVNICWFRRDLRVHDHAAFYHALKSGLPVIPIFIFDTNILQELESDDRRVTFIHSCLQKMNQHLQLFQSSMLVFHASPLDAFKNLHENYSVDQVFANHDYEPYAQQRDHDIEAFLGQYGIQFSTFKDHVIFEKSEVVKDDQTPYTVYTPYSKKWKAKLNDFYLQPYPVSKYLRQLFSTEQPFILPELKSLGFQQNEFHFPTQIPNHETIQQYHLHRDYPGTKGTSQLSIHLRFGTISIRELCTLALQTNEKFLNELIWRDFYQSILWHFPKVVHQSFKPSYDQIQWRNNEYEFDAWCKGQTGYPIVDAGMRELNETGWMHNRVRMIVASFLTKHLLIDWRWGEAYFAKKLNDFDLASNNGGWQWAAGCGVDAAPYFRIFNPYLQTLKFDPNLAYVRKWVPEFEEFTYPKPIVEHDVARKRCLEVYKKALHNVGDN